MSLENKEKIPMVCGRCLMGDTDFFPQAEYRGKTVYFCTEFCLNAFISDPDRFIAVHSRKYAREEPCGDSQP